LVILFVQMKALPFKRKELFQTLHSIVAQMKMGRGCIDLNVYQISTDESHFLLIGKWSTRKDSEAYLRSEIFTVLLGTRCLLLEPPQFEMFSADTLPAAEMLATQPQISNIKGRWT